MGEWKHILLKVNQAIPEMCTLYCMQINHIKIWGTPRAKACPFTSAPVLTALHSQVPGPLFNLNISI